MSLSPGQQLLRKIAVEYASRINPQELWDSDTNSEVLTHFRNRVMSERAVLEDDVTGQRLLRPAVPATYIDVQRMRYLSSLHQSVIVKADYLVFRNAGIDLDMKAASGGAKWKTTYGALTNLALGKVVSCADEAPPTLYKGSHVIAVGSGSNHRTLACFLWGDATIESDGRDINVVDDVLDTDLWKACETIEHNCVDDTEIPRIYLKYIDPGVKARAYGEEVRCRIIELACLVNSNNNVSNALVIEKGTYGAKLDDLESDAKSALSRSRP